MGKKRVIWLKVGPSKIGLNTSSKCQGNKTESIKLNQKRVMVNPFTYYHGGVPYYYFLLTIGESYPMNEHCTGILLWRELGLWLNC